MTHLTLLARKDETVVPIALKLGDKVTLEFEADQVETYEIGQEENFLSDPPIITLDSPIFKAVKGRRIGEWVTYDSPKGGKVTVKVVKVEGGGREVEGQ